MSNENQKPVTDEYRDNWQRIFGKKESSLISLQRDDCPPAYNGCTCSCHKISGTKHCVPCCYPSEKDYSDINNDCGLMIAEEGVTVVDDCDHPELTFHSGDYYVACTKCNRMWAMLDSYTSNAGPLSCGVMTEKRVKETG